MDATYDSDRGADGGARVQAQPARALDHDRSRSDATHNDVDEAEFLRRLREAGL